MKVHDKLLTLASVVALAHAGCATLEDNTVSCATLKHTTVRDEEARLAAAGFTARPADSPQRLATNAGTLPHKLVSQTKDDHFVYLYADPDYCRCVYEGGPEEYSAYQRILWQEEVTEERLAADDWPFWW